MSGILLDSVILIDHLNGVPEASAYLSELDGSAVISAVTRAEVRTGLSEKDVAALRLLDWFPVLPIDRDVADRAALLRRRERWKLPDAFQAALAQLHDLRLATRNTRDFPPERYGFVLVPYEVG